MGRGAACACAVGSAVLFGLIALFTGALYDAGATGFEIVFWRMLGAGALVGAVCLVAKAGVRVGRGAVGWVALASALYAGSVLALCLAYRDSSGGLANTLYHMYPVVFVLVAALALGRRPRPAHAVAVALAAAGAVVILAASLTAGAGWGCTPGSAALALASAVLFAFYSLALDRPELAGVSPLTLLFWQCAASVALCAPFVLAAPTHMEASPATGAVAALLAVACTAVPYVLYIVAAKAVGAQVPTLLSYLEMPVTIGSLALATGDVPGLVELAGCALIVLAGVLTVLPDREPATARRR